VSRGAVVLDLVREQLRRLKMPGVVRSLDSLLRQAREERSSLEDFLHECLAVEETSRHESAVRQRIQDARFPEMKTLDAFDFKIADGVDARVVADLARGEWVTEHRNVILAGPIGTGKTHLAIALGIEAARQRRHVGFHRAADLVRALVEARDAREVGRFQKRLDRFDVLILDEVGFVPFDRQGGELLFNVISQRHKRRSVVVTTNLAFGEWPKVFGGDEKLTTALLDRLAENAAVITTRGKSFRMRKRVTAGAAPGGGASPSAPE
jgi:DNA replication protein DnaC